MFKSFIATALIAVTAVTAPAGKAYTNYEQELLNALGRAGVEITKGDCSTSEIQNTYGFFHPEKNWIHICDDVATTHADVFETLRHEAVHAAQACVDPSMSSTLASEQWLIENGSAQDWQFIRAAYKQRDWMIELEAFTLMRTSNETITEIVDMACNS